MSTFQFENSPWGYSSTDKGHHATIYPKIPLTENQRIQWNIFNRLPLSNEQRERCIQRILQETTHQNEKK